MTDADAPARPTNVVVVLLDSMNRHMLGSYGGDEFETPHLDRFAQEKAVRFTRHVTGSLPCMPARHDILCGSLDFLWRPWGSIELWEEPITHHLRGAGVTTMLVSDHPHLFETGGENYHTEFTGWDYVRGHEGDPWRTWRDPTWVGAPARPAGVGRLVLAAARRRPAGEGRPYDRSRTFFRAEEDFPGPRVMRAASEWIRQATPHHDRWFLFVDEFDPHEPFDTPDPWAGRYDPDWDDDLIIWPPYDVGAVASGRLSERQARHIRANYGSKLSMIDRWFGEMVAALDEQGAWDDTAVIVTTDHGHYLGEQRGGADIWGKPGVMQYEPLGHIPLLVHWPGRGRRIDVRRAHHERRPVRHARRRVRRDRRARHPRPVARAAARRLGRARAGVGDRRRLRQLGAGHRRHPQVRAWRGRVELPAGHVVEPVVDDAAARSHPTGLPRPDRRARLDFMPGSDVPVIRQPFEPGDRLPFWVGRGCVDDHHVFDLDVDPLEEEDRAGTALERELTDLLRTALDEVEAPAEQYARLGL